MCFMGPWSWFDRSVVQEIGSKFAQFYREFKKWDHAQFYFLRSEFEPSTFTCVNQLLKIRSCLGENQWNSLDQKFLTTFVI